MEEEQEEEKTLLGSFFWPLGTNYNRPEETELWGLTKSLLF